MVQEKVKSEMGSRDCFGGSIQSRNQSSRKLRRYRSPLTTCFSERETNSFSGIQFIIFTSQIKGSLDCLVDLEQKGQKNGPHLGPFQVWWVSYIGRNPSCSELVIILTHQIERILSFFRGCCKRMELSKSQKWGLLSVGPCRFGLGIEIVERIVDTQNLLFRA